MIQKDERLYESIIMQVERSRRSLTNWKANYTTSHNAGYARWISASSPAVNLYAYQETMSNQKWTCSSCSMEWYWYNRSKMRKIGLRSLHPCGPSSYLEQMWKRRELETKKLLAQQRRKQLKPSSVTVQTWILDRTWSLDITNHNASYDTHKDHSLGAPLFITLSCYHFNKQAPEDWECFLVLYLLQFHMPLFPYSLLLTAHSKTLWHQPCPNPMHKDVPGGWVADNHIKLAGNFMKGLQAENGKSI